MMSLFRALAVLFAALVFLGRPTAAAEISMAAAMAAIDASEPESDAEARAMNAAIVAARTAHPQVPKEAQDNAADAEKDAAKANFAAAAQAMNSAARAAPWVAEYQFKRGGYLAQAELFAPAVRAFELYLQASPNARDRTEVQKLIAGLRNPGKQANHALAGETFRDCPKCPEMVRVPAGRFVMGSPLKENGRFDSEGPQHQVTVRAFALGKYPVTEEEFTQFLAATGYQPAPCNRLLDKTWRSPGNGLVFPPGQADLPRQPAVCVNWNDVQAYIAWLNKTAVGVQAGAYRLPTEAEWEYAARAGATTARWWGEEIGRNNANCQGCGSPWDNTLIAPVGSFAVNAFGISDVLGNTWEWMADCWNETYAGAPTDGSAWTTGDCTRRVMRGGSWSNLPAFIRSAARSRGDAGGADFDYSSYVGFRLAKTL